jgi:hypothetical protein
MEFEDKPVIEDALADGVHVFPLFAVFRHG